MRLSHCFLLLLPLSFTAAELRRICVCGPQRQVCPCPPSDPPPAYQNKLSTLRSRVFKAFSVPSAPVPRPIHTPQYYLLSRNALAGAATPSRGLDQPIGYVWTNTNAEAFYLDAATGKLLPTTRPRPLQQPQQQIPSFTTSSRQTLLVTGAQPQIPPSTAPFQSGIRFIRRPQQQFYQPNAALPPLPVPPRGIPLPVSVIASSPFLPPGSHQPHLSLRSFDPQQQQQSTRPSSSVLDSSEPNLVPLTQLTRGDNTITKKKRHSRKTWKLEKPRPGDVEDLSFVDGGDENIEDDISKKFKFFSSGAPSSFSIGEPAEVVKTKPRSLLETLPPGLIAKIAKKVALKLPPPKFSFSITPSKAQPVASHRRLARSLIVRDTRRI